jgi:hypothetical protein
LSGKERLERSYLYVCSKWLRVNWDLTCKRIIQCTYIKELRKYFLIIRCTWVNEGSKKQPLFEVMGNILMKLEHGLDMSVKVTVIAVVYTLLVGYLTTLSVSRIYSVDSRMINECAELVE